MISVIKAMVNTIAVSVPEELFASSVCLFILCGLLKDFSFLKFKETSNLKKFIILVLSPAIVSNIFRYIIPLDDFIILGIFALTMITVLIVIYRMVSIKHITFSVISVLGCIVANLIFEGPYYMAFSSAINKSADEISDDLLLAFISSIPLRAIQCGIVFSLIRKFRKDLEKIRILNVIKDNFLAKLIAIAMLCFNIIWLLGFWFLFVYSRIIDLFKLPTIASVVILFSVIIVPIITTISYMGGIYALRMKEIAQESIRRKKIKTAINIANSFAKQENYDKVKDILEDIQNI